MNQKTSQFTMHDAVNSTLVWSRGGGGKNFIKLARDALILSSADKCQESTSAYGLFCVTR